MVRKDKEEVRSSSVSICCGHPSAVPVGRKTSPNKGIHPAYPGYRSETCSQKIFFPLQHVQTGPSVGFSHKLVDSYCQQV